jgi:hypothetical protein
VVADHQSGEHQGGMSLLACISESNTVKLPRRQFLQLAAGAAALPALSRIAWTQTYPARPVRIIVGFAAGGSTDTTARLMGQWLGDRLGQPFIVENRPGANSNIAAETAINAVPDGYTLLVATVSNAVSATLYEKLKFNFTRDIAPVASLTRGTYVMVVDPLVPAKTIPEFIAYAKVNPGKVNMASADAGSGRRRRAVQGHDRREHASRAVSGRCAGTLRPTRGTGPTLLQHPVWLDRAHQGWQATRAGGDHRLGH